MKNLLISIMVFFAPLFSQEVDNKVYKVVITHEWKPYYSMNEQGQPDGYAIELFEAIAQHAGIQYEYVIKENFKEILQALKSSKVDIMPNMSITPQRREEFLFTQATDDFFINIYKRTASKEIQQLSDLKYTKMGVVPNNICTKLIEDEYPKIIKRFYSTYQELYQALLTEEVESFCYPKPLIDEIELDNKNISTLKYSLREIKRGMAVIKSEASLLPLFNKAIEELKMTGQLDTIYQKWFQHKSYVALTRSETLFLVISFFGILLTSFVIVFYFINKKRWLLTQNMLQVEVNRRTRLLKIQNRRLKKVQRKLQEQLNKDALTGIYNRKFYNEKIEELLALYRRYHLPFTFLMFDIDDFKNINDTYGHDVGDNVLKEFTQVVQQHIRNTDYFFRFGGEEFIILFADTDLQEALSVSEKIRELIQKNVNINSKKEITASFGLTEVQKHDTADTICKRADTLLYTAKANGKNQIQYDTIAIF